MVMAPQMVSCATTLRSAADVTCPGGFGCPVFSYPPIALEIGVTMVPVAPNVSSVGANVYAVVGSSLPAGLLFNASTGVISGTPSATALDVLTISGVKTEYAGTTHGGTLFVDVDVSVGPPANPLGLTFVDVNQREGVVGGRAVIVSPAASPFTYIDTFELHWAVSATERLKGRAPVVSGLRMTGANIVATVGNVTVPSGVTHLMVLSKNVSFGIRPVSVPIVDFGA
jgi:hypothetical protein